MPKKITPALMDLAVRMVLDHRAEYASTTAAPPTGWQPV